MIYVIKKKVLKKLKEFKSSYSYIRFYSDNKSVIYINLSHRTKVRTYLNLFLRIHAEYDKPVVLKFSVLRMIFLAKWFKEFNYIYFERPFSKLNKFKTFSHHKKADFVVSYKYKKIYSSDDYQVNALPYIMHPGNYLQNEIEILSKNIGILMSGNFEEKVYNTRVIPHNFGLNNRWEIYQELLKHDKLLLITGDALVENLDSGKYKNNLIIMKWQTGAISTEKWRKYLSASDFIFCAPGMTMPMCHNVLEAMSVGVIPILNYPHWLNPSLVNNQNCLVYENLSDIGEVVNRALSLSPEEKKKMSKSVYDYYMKFYASFEFNKVSGSELIVLNENLSDLI